MKRNGTGRVCFVGMGPGDLGLLTVRAVDLLREADVVVLDRGASAQSRDELVRTYCRRDIEVLDAAFGETGQPLTRAHRAKVLTKAAKGAGVVVRLLDGDGVTFTGVGDEMAACHKAGIPFEVVPGVSLHTAVPMYAGVPTTARGSDSIHVLDASVTVQAEGLVGDDTTVVIQGDRLQVAEAASSLAQAGRSGSSQVVVTSRGSLTEQLSAQMTLGELPTFLQGLADDAWPRPLVAVISPSVAERDKTMWFESKPLFAWKVLVPRTQAQAGPMVSALAHYGATAEVVPTISVEPPRTPHQMEKAIKGLVTGRYEWVGFTSVNAVKAIRERLTEFGLDARALSGLKVAAVGGVTADALREWGIEPDHTPAGEQSARGLLEDWPAYDDVLDPIDRVLLPRADIATETLVAGLQELGWQVDDVTAYRTVRAAPPELEKREAIKGGSFDAVVFTSSSTVRNLVGIAGKPHPTTVVACIGPATAKTAEELGLRVDVMAPESSALALVDALAEFGSSLRDAALAAGEPVKRPSERKPATRRRRVKA